MTVADLPGISTGRCPQANQANRKYTLCYYKMFIMQFKNVYYDKKQSTRVILQGMKLIIKKLSAKSSRILRKVPVTHIYIASWSFNVNKFGMK